MNNNEKKIFTEIIYYFKKNMVMPSIRYLQNKFNYKSPTSISQYLISLEKQNYLTRNEKNQLVINYIFLSHCTSLIKIKILNTANKYVYIVADNRKKYYAYKINNTNFIKDGILKNDILIAEKNKKILKNNLGLFFIDNHYCIMKYDYKDGFYILKDNDTIILNKVIIIGKIILIQRKI